MIILECEQRSEEWFAARRGIPTGSNFGKIITSQGKPASSQTTYMNTLLFEWATGATDDNGYESEWMRRGTELEPESRQYYEFETSEDVVEVGLIYKDADKLVSISPDGLVGDDGGLEMKNPKGSTQVSYFLGKGVPATYVPQVQGSLWLTGREWWDFLSYHPDCKKQFLHRAYRDEEYIAKLDTEVNNFIDKMLAKRDKLQKEGWVK